MEAVLGGRETWWHSAPLHTRVGADAGQDVPLGHPLRPTWRGRVHVLALWLAVPAFAALVAAADGPVRWSCVAYASGMCAVFATSATYHRWVHRLCWRARWRRADHAVIFAGMAGSIVPVAAGAAPGAQGTATMVVVALLAATGAASKLARWRRSDQLGSWCYVGVGVTGCTLLPALWQHGGVAPAVSFTVAALLDALGARCFARAWPRLSPSRFSYHEVWHVVTVVAAAAHFAAVWALVT